MEELLQLNEDTVYAILDAPTTKMNRQQSSGGKSVTRSTIVFIVLLELLDSDNDILTTIEKAAR